MKKSKKIFNLAKNQRSKDILESLSKMQESSSSQMQEIMPSKIKINWEPKSSILSSRLIMFR